MGNKLEALLGEIKEDCEQRKQWAARSESTRKKKAIWNVTPVMRPSKGGVGEQTKSTRNGLYLNGRVAGDSVRFLVDKGSNVLLIALQIWRRWGGGREELGHYRCR